MTKRQVSLWIAAALLIAASLAQPMADSPNERRAPVTWEQVLALPNEGNAPTAHRYGPAAQQTLLALQSANPSRAALLLIHGGCWSNAYDREHVLPMARALVLEGFDVWIPEYRRVGDPGGGWPGSLDDVVSAVQYVTQKAGTVPWLLGHSAGGHLALRAAYAPNVSVAGVLAMAAITDLTSYAGQDGSCQAMVPQLLDGTPENAPQRYRDASIDSTRIAVPVQLLLGDSDPIVGPDQLSGFRSSDTVSIAGAGHFDLIYPGTPAFNQVVGSLNRLMRHVSD